MKRSPLRRSTPLARSSSLARTAMVRRRELWSQPPTRRAPKRRRWADTGPCREVRTLVGARAGWSCERCRRPIWSDFSFHHRQPRGMGGSSLASVNSPANLLLLCGSGITGCHGWVESHRAEAEAAGYLVRRPTDPATVPFVVGACRLTLTRYLTRDGGYADTPEETR